MRTLIVGCGYIGMALAQELVRLGHRVYALRRTPLEAKPSGLESVEWLRGDIEEPGSLNALPGEYDWVVNTTSAGGGGVARYRNVYVEGNSNLIKWLSLSSPHLNKFIYTSSTGVYGQDDSSVVKEESPTEPATETGKILVEAERALMEAFNQGKFPCVILRVAGIYGPDRGFWFKEFLQDKVTIEGKGDRLMNMIHRDDVVGTIITALKGAHAGQIFNAVDDEPVTHMHFFRWLSETLGKEMPPFGPSSMDAESKRGATNKKVSNRKLKMLLGFQFKFPTYRQGLTEEIRRLDI
jgi:nucleoside-diphosphate-sugar epimerase